jgi:hypothetical protein
MERQKKLEPISIRLDPAVKAAIEQLARADDRTLSAYVNLVLRRHAEENRAKGKAAR